MALVIVAKISWCPVAGCCCHSMRRHGSSDSNLRGDSDRSTRTEVPAAGTGSWGCGSGGASANRPGLMRLEMQRVAQVALARQRARLVPARAEDLPHALGGRPAQAHGHVVPAPARAVVAQAVVRCRVVAVVLEVDAADERRQDAALGDHHDLLVVRAQPRAGEVDEHVLGQRRVRGAGWSPRAQAPGAVDVGAEVAERRARAGTRPAPGRPPGPAPGRRARPRGPAARRAGGSRGRPAAGRAGRWPGRR